MNGTYAFPPPLSSQPVWVLNCHSLAVKSSHFLDKKWACDLCLQLKKLSLVPDNQLAQLKVRQDHRIHMGTLILPGELLYPMLSLPNVVSPQLLEPCNNVANFSKLGFFLVWSWLIGQ